MCVGVNCLSPFLSKGETLYSLAYAPPYPCQGKSKRGLVIRSCNRGSVFSSGNVGIRRNCQLSGYRAVINSRADTGFSLSHPKPGNLV
jgi:hypothetical protein